MRRKMAEFDQKNWQEEHSWRMYRTWVNTWNDDDEWYDEWPMEYTEVWEEEEKDMGRDREERWDRRDKKRHKKKHGMRVTGSSVKLLERIIGAKGKRVSKEKSQEAEEA